MIYQALTHSFRLELLAAVHNVSTNTLKMALYGSTANLSEATTAYTATGECSGAGYVAGGSTVVPTITQNAIDGTVLIDFADLVFPSVSITARGGLIYNSSQSNKSVVVIDFGLDITRSGADLTVRFPTPDDSNAIIRIK